jgi:outer membrane protein assembly factor BamD
MKITGKLITLALSVLVSMVVVTGCSTGKDIIKEDDKLVDSANNLYARERFTEAEEKYRRIIDEFPDSSYRKLSILGLADSLYKQKEFFEAALFYERFKELYPLDQHTPRARFYLAMSHYNDTTTSDRDQSSAHKAVGLFGDFIKTYPNNPLAPYARDKKSELISLMAESEMEIIRFYYKINKNQSAIMRIWDFLENTPGAKQAPEALFILGESYMREQSFKKAAQTYMEIMEKYPDSEYSQRAAVRAKKLQLKN